MKTSPAVIVGCVVSLFLGAAVGWRWPLSMGETEKSERVVASPTPSPTPARGGRPASSALVESIRHGTGAKRWLELLSTLENARTEDLPGLLLLVRDDPAMVWMLAKRWAELDPHHMFGALYTDSFLPEDAPNALPTRWVLTEVLLQHWTRTDLPALIKALNDVPEFYQRGTWRRQAFNQVMKLDVERALQLLSEWDIKSYSPDMKGVSAWAARDPRHAMEVIGGLTGGVAVEVLEEVGKAWAQSDPMGGLRFASTLDKATRVRLGGQIMRQWAEKNLKAAIAFTEAETDPKFRVTLAQGLVAAWGRTDPAAALAWSEAKLSGPARAVIIGGLVQSAAEKNIATAGDLVAGMEPGPTQIYACASVFQTWFKKGADQREAALAWLSGFSDPDARREAMGRIQWDWVWQEPDAARDFISGPYGYMANAEILSRTGSRQAAKNPEAALAWANSLGKELAPDARRGVVEGWFGVRPDAAADYVLQLPAGADRDKLVDALSWSFIHQSPGQVGSWYRRLSPAEQTAFRTAIERSGLHNDRRRKLEAAMKGE